VYYTQKHPANCICNASFSEDNLVMKILAALFLLILSNIIVSAQPSSSAVRTVPAVDLNRYSGKWYEIARYPNKFQKDCVANTTATYTRKQNGKIEVLNECLKKDGLVNSAKAEAKVADKGSNAKLKVRFAPGFLSVFGFVWADYWIIDLGANYEYAVVADPKREYLWILSRDPELKESVYQSILQRVENQGFQPGKLVKTRQKAETVKGAVVGQGNS
jgi:apolipoprotein D and lipocalin family protein